MPISAQEAADVAAARGLSLSDARALRGLAESVEEAEKLADRFRREEHEHEQAARIADRVLGYDK